MLFASRGKIATAIILHAYIAATAQPIISVG